MFTQFNIIKNLFCNKVSLLKERFCFSEDKCFRSPGFGRLKPDFPVLQKSWIVAMGHKNGH